MSTLFKNIFIVLALIVTAVLGFYLYTQNVGSDSKASNRVISESVTVQTANFLRRLNELKAIELDSAIFSDPRFNSLITFQQPSQAEPVGRTNPFELN